MESVSKSLNLPRHLGKESPILSIDTPADGLLRARKVVTRSKARCTGKYPSWKMGRMMQYESSHEQNAFRLLDANPSVSAFYEQPLTVRYCLHGEERLHYPDILVLLDGRKELWEVKDRKGARDTEVVERTQTLSAYLPNHGYTYRVVIGEDLAVEPRLSNVLQLLAHGRNKALSLKDHEMVRRVTQVRGAITWGDAKNGSIGPDGRRILARLMLEGHLYTDLSLPLGDSSLFAPIAREV